MDVLSPSAFSFDILQELAEEGRGGERAHVTREDELLAGPREGDVELAVNGVTVLDERVGREEVELIRLLDGERIDDDVALGALVTLYGVDTDGVEIGDAEALNLLTDHRYLVAVRHDDTHCLVGVKLGSVEAVDTPEDVCDNACFLDVHFVGDLRLAAVLRWEEEHAVRFQQVIDSVQGWQLVTDGCGLLMG